MSWPEQHETARHEPDAFEAVRREPDPLRRARRALELQTVYQQRAVELSRLRRTAIEDAYRGGMSYQDIAAALGVTKGRITQIRSNAPPSERAFFGVGPVAVGVPLRHGADHRERTYVDAWDAATREHIGDMAAGLSLTVTGFTIEPTTEQPPAGDVVAICGPLSAALGAALLDRDPHLTMTEANGRWWIEERGTGKRHGSPWGDEPQLQGDLGYVARHREAGRVIVHIAGIHSFGSLGAAHYLAHHLAELFVEQGDEPFSLVVRCTFDGLTITGAELVLGPYRW